MVPKQLDATYEELMTPRSTLQETYDQVIADCDAAIADLPGTAMSGKATKWAAHALKSRASLYAARIAKYHPQSADGLTSIPGRRVYWVDYLITNNPIISSFKKRCLRIIVYNNFYF